MRTVTLKAGESLPPLKRGYRRRLISIEQVVIVPTGAIGFEVKFRDDKMYAYMHRRKGQC